MRCWTELSCTLTSRWYRALRHTCPGTQQTGRMREYITWEQEKNSLWTRVSRREYSTLNRSEDNHYFICLFRFWHSWHVDELSEILKGSYWWSFTSWFPPTLLLLQVTVLNFLFSTPYVHVIESIHSKNSTLLILINNNDIKIIWTQMFGGIDREKPVYAVVWCYPCAYRLLFFLH